MRLRFLLLSGLFLYGFTLVLSQERYIKPVDEGKNDASFNTFRTKLIAAAEKRDAKYVLSVIDRNIQNGFGGSNGFANFKKTWKIENPKAEFWDEFLRVIKNGGSFSSEGGGPRESWFWAPYTYTSFPQDIDSFEHQAIFGNNVNLREKPTTDSDVVASLSYNIVKTDYQDSVKTKNSEDEYEWLKVETLGGKKGYVKAEYVRSPIDYRACFEKKGGVWKLTAFLAGD
ncbi:MAG: SH3 domain-containing protein [Saprospiraceae bacterium]|nr:SH3 domain-containing protein [Pyrinomonadaceae bacterium]